MRYRHRFVVQAPVEAVAAFHRRPGSMAAITPPPIRVRELSAPAALEEGDCMAFTLAIGPLAIPWEASIYEQTERGFTDRQHVGPFAYWEHRHSFIPLANGSTEVLDEVQGRLRRHVFWGPLGTALWLGLPLLFTYRGWKTRRLLEGAL